MANILSGLQKGAVKPRKRVGRGPASGHGKTCSRGHNGYKSRSGSTTRMGYEGGQMPLYKKLPTRGFDRAKFAKLNVTVTLGEIDRMTKDGDVFTPASLVKAKKLTKSQVGIYKYQLNGRKADAESGAKAHEADFSKVGLKLKVIDSGEITKKVDIIAHSYSASALKKLEKMGIKPQVIAERKGAKSRKSSAS